MSARSDTGGGPPPPHFPISAIFFDGYVPILETFNRDPILASHMTAQSVGIHQCIGNSAKLRILMVLKDNGPMTAKQMISAGVGIPQTTLYRLLRNMEENGILAVVSENKVRAMTERTYDVSDSLRDFDAEMIGRNDLEGYCRMFEGFTFNLLKEFESYARRDVRILASGVALELLHVQPAEGVRELRQTRGCGHRQGRVHVRGPAHIRHRGGARADGGRDPGCHPAAPQPHIR